MSKNNALSVVHILFNATGEMRHISSGSGVGKYQDFVVSLPRTTTAFKDLRRTMVLINNALPDMFYYLENVSIHSTTNALEGFHSRLKTDYQRHRGLTKEHRLQYINWYCYYENKAKTNYS